MGIIWTPTGTAPACTPNPLVTTQFDGTTLPLSLEIFSTAGHRDNWAALDGTITIDFLGPDTNGNGPFCSGYADTVVLTKSLPVYSSWTTVTATDVFTAPGDWKGTGLNPGLTSTELHNIYVRSQIPVPSGGYAIAVRTRADVSYLEYYGAAGTAGYYPYESAIIAFWFWLIQPEPE